MDQEPSTDVWKFDVHSRVQLSFTALGHSCGIHQGCVESSCYVESSWYHPHPTPRDIVGGLSADALKLGHAAVMTEALWENELSQAFVSQATRFSSLIKQVRG